VAKLTAAGEQMTRQAALDAGMQFQRAICGVMDDGRMHGANNATRHRSQTYAGAYHSRKCDESASCR